MEARRFPGEKGGRDQVVLLVFNSPVFRPVPGLHIRLIVMTSPLQGGESSYKRRIESDSEEEYDSELDDFIDDSGDKMDIGKEIRSIFG